MAKNESWQSSFFDEERAEIACKSLVPSRTGLMAGRKRAFSVSRKKLTAMHLDKTPRSLLIMTCDYCGMDRGQYAHSRMLVTYDDGSDFGACSLHCAVLDLAIHLGKTPKRFHVGDYRTKQLIDAESAFWVIGGSKVGVMTERGKWTFEIKKDAEAFVRSNGGTLATFDEAIKAAYEDMYVDWKTTRARKKVRKMQMPEEHKR